MRLAAVLAIAVIVLVGPGLGPGPVSARPAMPGLASLAAPAGPALPPADHPGTTGAAAEGSGAAVETSPGALRLPERPAETPAVRLPAAPRGEASFREPVFYRGLPYGSEALVHPVRLVLNGGFGILQFADHDNRLPRLRFARGARRMWSDVSAPGRTIGIAGWNDFLLREVLPVSAKRHDAQYWPNYTLHLVGGGMSNVMMREWYERHGSRNPSLHAGLTLTAYHVLNEIVEAESRTQPSTDAVADLLLFNPAGMLIFAHEGVAGFFGNTLHMRDWSTQAAIDPSSGAIENQGQNFSMKLALPGESPWSLFYYFGNHGELGLSYRRPNGSAFSVGAGLRAKSLIELGDGVQTAELVPSYGLFYDRDGSLMFSVTAAKTSRYGVRVNAYPGLLNVRGWTAGLFLLTGRDGGTIAGLHLVQFPVGLAGRRD